MIVAIASPQIHIALRFAEKHLCDSRFHRIAFSKSRLYLGNLSHRFQSFRTRPGTGNIGPAQGTPDNWKRRIPRYRNKGVQSVRIRGRSGRRDLHQSRRKSLDRRVSRHHANPHPERIHLGTLGRARPVPCNKRRASQITMGKVRHHFDDQPGNLRSWLVVALQSIGNTPTSHDRQPLLSHSPHRPTRDHVPTHKSAVVCQCSLPMGNVHWEFVLPFSSIRPEGFVQTFEVLT